ncbi:MAG: hypothetical protein QM647_11685 [Asticcacaulis sp.]|uniref:hypothetical protein n=1 Tax=Asticcacaulis sp. TaxID=1872648 RepID=UPI0039E472EC
MSADLNNLAVIDIFTEAAWPIQALMLILTLFSLSALVIAGIKLRGEISGGSAWLSALRWAGPLAGGVGAAYIFLFSFVALKQSGDVPLSVMAPGLAEVAFVFGLGLLSGVIAVIANAAIHARIDRAVLGSK